MLPDIGIVEKHYAAIGNFWQPRLKIVLNRIVGVQAVYVKQVDRAVLKIGQGIIKGAANQAREPAITRIMITSQFDVNFIRIFTRMLVTSPGIHRITTRIKPGFLHRLAKREIRVTGMGSEFDQATGTQHFHQPRSERDMPNPCRGRSDPVRVHKHG